MEEPKKSAEPRFDKNKTASKEEAVVSIQYKIDCHKRAVQVVESLLAESLSEERVAGACRLLDQNYYRDATQERAIAGMCGYPLCSNGVTLEAKRQRYKISTKQNKVYDVTYAQNFCSVQCYEASQYLSMQISSAPMWVREEEESVDFQFLNAISDRIPLGEEVRMKLPDEYILQQQVKKLELLDKRDQSTHLSGANIIEGKTKAMKVPTTYLASSGSERHKVACDDVCRGDNKAAAKTSEPLFHTNREQVAMTAQKPESMFAGSSGSMTKPSVMLMQRIKTCLHEWRTIDTLVYILEQDKVDQMYAVENRIVNDCSHEPEKESVKHDEDDDADQSLAQGTKPLPSIEQLRTDADKYKIKVKEFYKGRVYVEDASARQDPPVESVADSAAAACAAEEGATSDIVAPIVPLVDSKSQSKIRRRIVVDKVRKGMTTFLAPLGLTQSDIREDLADLIYTFNLSSHNIVFKPGEWILLNLILLKLLALRSKRIGDGLVSSSGASFVKTIGRSFHVSEEEISQLIDSLLTPLPLIPVHTI